MLFSSTKTSPFVNGECLFEEDRLGPPSRAYLKLWECWVLNHSWPRTEQRCIDLGASPGGWTWAAAQLGASVIAIDKSPLDARVLALPKVSERIGSAFTLVPEPCDWLLCDVIAYPDKQLSLVQRWIDSGVAKRIVCTIKFQGKTDHDAADAFSAIPGAVVRHMSHNKHELMFMWKGDAEREKGDNEGAANEAL